MQRHGHDEMIRRKRKNMKHDQHASIHKHIDTSVCLSTSTGKSLDEMRYETVS